MSTAVVQNCAKTYRETRHQVIALVEKAISSRNELSYVSDKKLLDVAGAGLRPSTISLAFEGELASLVRKIEERQQDMLDAVVEMSAAVDATDPVLLSVDATWLHSLIGTMQQQLTLEMSLSQKLLTLSEQDSLVTLLACFKYPPFLRADDLEQLVR
jgi:hypothetical protein